MKTKPTNENPFQGLAEATKEPIEHICDGCGLVITEEEADIFGGMCMECADDMDNEAEV